MSDPIAAIELLLKRHLATEAKLQALSAAFTRLLADQALNHDEPEHFIMSVLATILETGESIPPSDPDTGHIPEALSLFHHQMEQETLAAFVEALYPSVD